MSKLKIIDLSSGFLRIAAWAVCVLCAWFGVVELSFLENGGGWAFVGFVQLLLWGVPAAAILCLAPLAYLGFALKRERDKKSLKIAGIPLGLFVIETAAVMYFAPPGSGC